jgi:hypothetical protein
LGTVELLLVLRSDKPYDLEGQLHGRLDAAGKRVVGIGRE